MTDSKSIMGIKQFRNGNCYSYFVFDRESHETAIVDPVFEAMEDYRSSLIELRLKPVITVDTRLHCDHFSATHVFHSEFDVPIAMSHVIMSRAIPNATENSANLRMTRALVHGEVVQVGGLKFEVIDAPLEQSVLVASVGALPGASSVALCGHGLAFCGDAISVGLSSEIHKNFLNLPGSTLLFPAHSGLGLLFSKLEIEKKRISSGDFAESQVGVVSQAEASVFRTFNQDLSPAYTSQLRSGNARQPEITYGSFRIATISVEKIWNKIKKPDSPILILDVREPVEYGQKSIEGSLNVPISELGLHCDSILAGMRKVTPERVYVICNSGSRSELVTRTLAYNGFPDVINISGGIKAWMHAGLPLLSQTNNWSSSINEPKERFGNN